MTFASANAAVAELWSSLRSFVGKSAVSEITVRPPAGEDDEASFLRLVAWSYVMAFEAGRVAIPYLMELPGCRGEPQSDPRRARQIIHALRTWCFHNLGFISDRDAKNFRRVQLWFIEACGEYPPKDAGAWRCCFRALCSEVEIIVTHCQHVMTTVLSSTDDGQAVTTDLRRRIDRNWPACEYHALVGDAAIRLGISVDARKFSGPQLAKWQLFLLRLPEHDDPRGHMLRLIERDLLDWADEILPIDGRDVMTALKLNPGPEVGDVLRRARELVRSGVRDRRVLIERLIAEHQSQTTQGE